MKCWVDKVCVHMQLTAHSNWFTLQAVGFSWKRRGTVEVLPGCSLRCGLSALPRYPNSFLLGISFFQNSFQMFPFQKAHKQTEIPTFLKMFAKFTKEGGWFQLNVPLFVVNKSDVDYMNIFSHFSCLQPTLTVKLLATFKLLRLTCRNLSFWQALKMSRFFCLVVLLVGFFCILYCIPSCDH